MSDTTLRASLIRLAHAQPELRPALLPILKEAAQPPASQYVGGAAATIKGDYRYYTELNLYWDAPRLTITVSSKSPIGGMDGPGGAHDLEERARAVVTVDGPRDAGKAIAQIKKLIQDDEVLKNYAKQKDFTWGPRAAPPKARGLNAKLLVEALFPTA